MNNSRKRKNATPKVKPAPRRVAKPEAQAKIEERIDWKGIALSVGYEADWCSGAFNVAHLEVRVIEPAAAVLPITDTGYRSHFLPRIAVENAGGPVAYVKAWLEHEAKAPEWKRREATSRQLCLF